MKGIKTQKRRSMRFTNNAILKPVLSVANDGGKKINEAGSLLLFIVDLLTAGEKESVW